MRLLTRHALTRLLMPMGLAVGLSGAAQADITWSWSFGTEAGTFVTDGALVGTSAPAGVYNVLDISVTQSSFPGNLGAMTTGELDEGSQPGTGFTWDGTADTQWFRAAGVWTNGANYYSNVTQHRYLFFPGFYVLYDGNDNTLLSSATLSLTPGVGAATPFCFGDGSGAICPCGNLGAAGEGCANSAGAGALLVGSGAADLANDTFVLEASQCPPNRPGLFFQGTQQVSGGAGSLLGDGLRCAGGPVVRLEVVMTNGGGGATSSVVVSAQSTIAPGETRTYQFWYRDPAGPCSGQFNLTNGLEQTW